MRNLLMTTAMILTLGVATPALADGYNGRDNDNGAGYSNGNGGDYGRGNGNGHQANVPAPSAPEYEHSARFDRDVNAWERGWSPIRVEVRFGNHGLTSWQLTRRLEAQGYYRVHDLTPARFGSWRATAMYRGHRVIVRVDQFSGRVLAARYI
jgi:hypothetical protein